MPVLKKEIELSNGTKIWVKQASGLDKLRIEAKQGRVMRKCRSFGSDLSAWTEEQMDEFMDLCEKEECGLAAQVESWLPSCLLDKELDLLVCNEIADQLNESVQTDSKGRKKTNANKAIARRDQKRKLHTPAETSKQLNALIKNKGE